MKKLLLLLFFLFFAFNILSAQKYKTTQAYGVVDTADLHLKDCDFEKGASAMVLFDKAEVSTSIDSIIMYRHRRIKIFNNAGKDAANFRLEYLSYHNAEKVLDLQAQTINLENGHVVYTKLEPGQIFTEKVDKNQNAIVFAFPAVKPGSIIEYKYKWKTISAFNFPVWFFQDELATRYSELTAIISPDTKYKTVKRGYQPFVLDTLNIINKKGTRKHTWAKANVKSLSGEPFVTPGISNYQCIIFQLQSFEYDRNYNVAQTWHGIATDIGFDSDFGEQPAFRLNSEDTIITKAKTMTTTDQKIAYLFGLVKSTMKWNKVDQWYTDKGIRSAWANKTGNSTEISLILYRLLKKSGVDAHTMLVCTREKGEISPFFPSYHMLNRGVVYVPIDSTRCYLLDATSKYNVYDNIPSQFINTYGLYINREGNFASSKLVLLKNEQPAQQVVMINADIKPDGKINGSAEITNYSYNKAKFTHLYDTEGEKKYIDILNDRDNNMSITGLKIENMDVDSLPMIQNFNFELEPTSADNQYIYFDPNIFTPVHTNPFLSEERWSDIDFGNCNSYSINGRYKLPPGYKIEALPKSLLVSIFDKSISFKRVIGEANGYVELHYTITRTKSKYSIDDYKPIREFYKKMVDMLSEPVVLKKG